MTWSILVLIPKTSGGTRGIGLLEIMWKVVSSIINKRLQTSIPFHEALHGFRRCRGTGTASLNAKLQMQLAHIQGVPLYQLFLDLSKAYDTLDRTQMLQLLNRYGVGGNILRLLTNFWNSLFTSRCSTTGILWRTLPLRTWNNTTQYRITNDFQHNGRCSCTYMAT
jgi:hypothetical protein